MFYSVGYGYEDWFVILGCHQGWMDTRGTARRAMDFVGCARMDHRFWWFVESTCYLLALALVVVTCD